MSNRQSLYEWCISNNKEELLREWDSEKNSKIGLFPEKVGCKSSIYKAYWICPKNHSYQAFIGNRTRRGDGCCYCSNHELLKGFNDLLSVCPAICNEWDYAENTRKHDEDIANGKANPHPATPSDIL